MMTREERLEKLRKNAWTREQLDRWFGSAPSTKTFEEIAAECRPLSTRPLCMRELLPERGGLYFCDHCPKCWEDMERIQREKRWFPR